MANLFPCSTVQSSCAQIMKCSGTFSLNFSINETLYSIYLTVRKSFSKSSENFPAPISTTQEGDKASELECLAKQLKVSESANFSLQKNFEDALNECETYLKQMDALEMKVNFFEEKDKSKENYLKKKKT